MVQNVVIFLAGTGFLALFLCIYCYPDKTFPQVWGAVIVGFVALLLFARIARGGKDR